MLKQFKTESKRILDLMINSIYTNKEIFLREVISNASDAIDKLHYISLTDSAAARDFEVRIDIDKSAGTLSISDNGIGMNRLELENNLGTIAKSGTLEYKAADEKAAEELIGQFGVGFYSCFMVADEVTVTSQKYGDSAAFVWKSKGADGYSVKEAPQLKMSGTTVTLKIKQSDEGYDYSQYLDMYTIRTLIKKYSDYIRYPIRAMIESQKTGKDGKNEIEVTEQTLNSMLPIWKKGKGTVKEEEYEEFYMSIFHDYEKPLKTIYTKVEGAADYTALLFIPSRLPYDFHAKDYKSGLKLYSAGVLIMDNCEKLLSEEFGFIKGIVDSSDLSLNISREILQNDRQLSAIKDSLNKKIMTELARMRDANRETYEKMFGEFGLTIKFGAYNNFGAKIDELKDYFLFYSGGADKYVTLKEYVAAMGEGQTDIYYAAGSALERVSGLPQVSALKKKGYNVLLLTDSVDEFLVKIMNKYDGKNFVSALGGKLDDESEKAGGETKKPLLDEMKTALKNTTVKDVKFSNMLGDFASGLSASGELSIEMAKVLSMMPGGQKMTPDFVLEINPNHPLTALAEKLLEGDKEKFTRLTKLLYEEAQLTLGNLPENPTELVALINEFIA